MNKWAGQLLCLACILTQLPAPAQTPTQTKESTANTNAMPAQILRTGVKLSVSEISPNTMQLANTIGLAPILDRIQPLRSRISSSSSATLEGLSNKQDLFDTVQKASLLIQKTSLEIDFTLAEINAELQIYDEILATYTSDRDKLLARVNAASFISNGLLWTVCEGLSIPSYNGNVAVHPKSAVRWSIPSGITGIAAGIVPSLASMYTLKAVNGKRKTSEVDPNMLAKLFGYPTNPEIEYPRSVWEYLNQVPAANPQGKKRLDQLIDRWISDSNIPDFTDRTSKKQLDVITASLSQRKGLSIGTLTTRQVMLQQVSNEIMKMKRMLLELAMAVDGEKQFRAEETSTLR